MDIRITQHNDGNYVAEDHEEHCTSVDTSPILALIGLLAYMALDDAMPYDEDDEDGRYERLQTTSQAVSHRIAGRVMADQQG